MYNSDDKMIYIRELENRGVIGDHGENGIRWAFQASEEMETALDKDVSTFTTGEALAMYKTMYSSALETLLQLNGHLMRYTRYMLSRNLVPDGQNHFEEIDTKTLHYCLNLKNIDNRVITREQVLEQSKELLNESDKFLVLAFFEGFGGRMCVDFAGLKAEDFTDDGDEAIVTFHSGRAPMRVSKTLANLARRSAEEYEYYVYQSSTAKFQREIMPFLPDDDGVLKSKYNARASMENAPEEARRRRIYNQFVRIRDELGSPAYSASALRESGRIEMIKRLMEEDNEKDPAVVVKAHQDEIVERYGNLPNSTVARYLMQYGSYLTKEEASA